MTTAMPNSSLWPFICVAATTLVRAIIEPIERSIPPLMTHDGLGHGGQGQRQDRDGEALDAGHAVVGVDELGENEQHAQQGEQANTQPLRRAQATSASAGPRPLSYTVPVAALIGRPCRPARRPFRPAPGAVGSVAAASSATTSAATASGSTASERRLYAARSSAGSSASADVDLGHHTATEDDDRPVAGELDLLELGRVEEDGRTGRCEVAQQHVDLALRADVDAARRIEAEHRLDAAGDPAGDGHLLLVAAR